MALPLPVYPAGAPIRRVSAQRHVAYDIAVLPAWPDVATTLQTLIHRRRVLVVSTPTVARFYARPLVDAIKNGCDDASLVVMNLNEATKTLASVEWLCTDAARLGLDRRAVLVSVGGGNCSDIVTFAASVIHRGITHIRIPTTLLGQVDAAVGVKGAVNFAGRKSFLGCFYPPGAVLLAPDVLGTLPAAQLRQGFAEMVKIGLVRSAGLFDRLERHWPSYLGGALQTPDDAIVDTIRRSIDELMIELEGNLFEDRGYERIADFGHTFSPLIETRSGYRIHHGEAVALDIALSASLAATLGLLSGADRDRIHRLLSDSGLPVRNPLLTPSVCRDALEDASRRRGGNPNLVLPTGIGRATFIRTREEISDRDLREAIRQLPGLFPAVRDQPVAPAVLSV